MVRYWYQKQKKNTIVHFKIMECANKMKNLIKKMKDFLAKDRKNLYSSTNFNKFTVTQRSEIRLLRNSNKKEIQLLKVMQEII